MVHRSEYECSLCGCQFYFRFNQGRSNSARFRINCPGCQTDMHGEITINYRNADGTFNSPKQTEFLKVITGAKKLKDGSITVPTATAVTIYTDIPIIAEEYQQDYQGNSEMTTAPAMPMMQIMRCLGDQSKEFIEMIDYLFRVPEDQFRLIRQIYNKYKEGNLEKVNYILKRMNLKPITELSLVPSFSGKLYLTTFMGLVGPWEPLAEYLERVDKILKKDPHTFFSIMKVYGDLDFIENAIERSFNIAEEMYTCRVFLTMARYFDYCDLDIVPKHRITHDYPELQFHLYEQLCEYNHLLIKFYIALINVQVRNSIDSFSSGRYQSYSEYFTKATLFESLDLIKESDVAGTYFGGHINREIRNGIAHQTISYSLDGQKIIVNNKGVIEQFEHDKFLVDCIALCRSAINSFGIVTDIKRLTFDKPWESFEKQDTNI
jgi:hypothetical protein